jgi:ribosomal protein S18 acetylase RimI-like enzyme
MIDEATKKDGKAIRKITVTSGFFSEGEVATVDELWDEYIRLGSKTSGYYFLIFRGEEKVLGFACYGPHPLTESTYDLYWIVTDNRAKGQGVGKALMAEVEKEVAVLGGSLLIAETSGRELYKPTRGFYKKRGYLKEAVIKDFYAPGDDLVMYTKKLG